VWVQLWPKLRRGYLLDGVRHLHDEPTASELIARFADATGIPVAETFGGKGAIQNPGPWHVWGIGLEGSPETNRLVEQADVIFHIGTRLTDFATGSQSLFQNPDVKFVSLNVSEFDGVKQGAATIVADARTGLEALFTELGPHRVPPPWSAEVAKRQTAWRAARDAAIDPDVLFPTSTATDPDGDQLTRTWTQLSGARVTLAADGFTAPALKSDSLLIFELTVSDVDRGVYESVTLKVARHPSETMEYLATRVLVRPGVDVLATCQHRVSEKTFFGQAGVPTNAWRAACSIRASRRET
jgi:hypothetical protein